MIRAVVDTNALASGFTSRAGPSGRILHYWRRGSFDLSVSRHILTELERALAKPYFAARLTPGQRRSALELLVQEVVLTHLPGTPEEHAARPPDSLVLETAVRAGAGYLVTGDKELQELGTFQGVLILSPLQFLDLLERGEGN